VSAIVEQGSLEVVSLAEQFAVSQSTIRRDLELLEMQRLVRRTHGGATIHAAFIDLPLNYKKTKELTEKRRIAQRALDFIGTARVIGLTGGTTVSEFASLLMDRNGLTVVTSSLDIAISLAANPEVRVFAAGGEVRSSSQEAVGPAAEKSLSAYNVDVSFLGVDGVDAVAGCTNYDPMGARVNAILQQNAKLSVVLADATKISRVTLAQVCAMANVDVLITDSRAPQSALDQIREQGCQVVCA